MWDLCKHVPAQVKYPHILPLRQSDIPHMAILGIGSTGSRLTPCRIYNIILRTKQLQIIRIRLFDVNSKCKEVQITLMHYVGFGSFMKIIQITPIVIHCTSHLVPIFSYLISHSTTLVFCLFSSLALCHFPVIFFKGCYFAQRETVIFPAKEYL